MKILFRVLTGFLMMFSIASPNIYPAKTLVPATLVDISGHVVNLHSLSENYNLFIVTLKATWCPVCKQQLLRIRSRQNLWKNCNAYFIVLSGGGSQALTKIKKKTGFPFPFVDDKNFVLSKKLGLYMGQSMLRPAILHINPNLEIDWMQIGRSSLYYGDKELEDFLGCKIETT